MLAGLVAAASLLVVGLGVVTSRIGDDEPQRQVAGVPVSAQPSATGEPTTSATAPTTSAGPAVAEQLHWPPRVLLDSGWDVVSANERSIDEGYITFAHDGVTVFVGWYRGDVSADDRWREENGFTAVGDGTLLGHAVTMYAGPLAYRVGDIEDLIDRGVLPPDVLGEAPTSDPEPPPSDAGARSEDDELVGGPILEEQLSRAIADGQIEGVESQGLETTLSSRPRSVGSGDER